MLRVFMLSAIGVSVEAPLLFFILFVGQWKDINRYRKNILSHKYFLRANLIKLFFNSFEQNKLDLLYLALQFSIVKEWNEIITEDLLQNDLQFQLFTKNINKGY
jgi:hypothetical protein